MKKDIIVHKYRPFKWTNWVTPKNCAIETEYKIIFKGNFLPAEKEFVIPVTCICKEEEMITETGKFKAVEDYYRAKSCK